MSGGPSNPIKTTENLTYREVPEGTTIDEQLLARILDETDRRIEARIARPSPMNLRTWEEIEDFAERVTRSNLCPKDFKEKPDDAIIAVMKGNELGLPPMASLESICVVNGRPSVWGDAVPGLCMQTGKVQDVVEYFEGEPGSGDFSAVCIVTRRGMTPREGRFSLGDVARAGLKNVHALYPKDMIMWRARHRAWHGAFPDVLKGLGTAEIEAEEARRPAWPMPQPKQSWFERKKAEGWDTTWFEAFVDRLLAETNAWKWLDLLVTGLQEAPTARDVAELKALPVVDETVAAAPDEAKKTIADAFAAADVRLKGSKDQTAPSGKPDEATQATETKPKEQTASEQKPPAATTPPQEAETSTDQADGFEAYLLDEFGDPIGDDPLMTPVGYASALWNLVNSKPAQRINIIEQNADGIADATAADPKAAEMLARLTADDGSRREEAEAAGEIFPIALAIERGKGNWAQYLRDFKSAMAEVPADLYLEVIAANHPTFAKAPASSRMLIVKACVERAKALGIDPPAILTQTTVAASASASNTAHAAAQEAQQSPAPPKTDADETAVTNRLGELAQCKNANECIRWSNLMTTTTLRSRLEREGKVDMVKRIDMAFNDRMAELRAGA